LCKPIARGLATRAMERAANENMMQGEAIVPSSDALLRAALRHFADHGIAAAREAGALATAARDCGDQQGYEWWLGVTRTLDRRLAARMEAAN